MFLAPSIVAESLKGAHLLSYVMGEELGYECNPVSRSPRSDIVQAVKLKSREKVIQVILIIGYGLQLLISIIVDCIL